MIIISPLDNMHMSTSENDQLLDDVRQATEELQPDWYSLAIELGIDYKTRRVRAARLF